MTAAATPAAAPQAAAASSWSVTWRRLRRHRAATASLVVLSGLVVLAILAPVIAPYDPAALDVTDAYAGSSAAHLMGTDALGRDVFSRVLHAGRISLLVGFLVALLSTIIGVGAGLVAGYFAGQPVLLSVGPASSFWARTRRAEGASFWPRNVLRWTVWAIVAALVVSATRQFSSVLAGPGSAIALLAGGSLALLILVSAFAYAIRIDLDNLISRLIDVMLSVPSLPFLLILAGLIANPDVGIGPALDRLLGPARSVATIIAVLVLFGWLATARLVRGTVLALREAEFAEAARGLGGGDARIMFRHLLPNAVAPIIVQVTLDVGYAIIAEAALSFLGFGIQEPTASWGNMLTGAQEAIFQQPIAVFWPGLFILLTTLSINFLGDGLRDALDPRSRL